MNEAYVAACAALKSADDDLKVAVGTLRSALVARGVAAKARERARQGTGGVTPTAQDVFREESESFLASIGGYPNGERVELVTYLPNGWRP